MFLLPNIFFFRWLICANKNVLLLLLLSCRVIRRNNAAAPSIMFRSMRLIDWNSYGDLMWSIFVATPVCFPNANGAVYAHAITGNPKKTQRAFCSVSTPRNINWFLIGGAVITKSGTLNVFVVISVAKGHGNVVYERTSDGCEEEIRKNPETTHTRTRFARNTLIRGSNRDRFA